jgi:hypothetical protein
LILRDIETIDVFSLTLTVLNYRRNGLIEQESRHAFRRYAEIHNFSPIHENLNLSVIVKLPDDGIFALMIFLAHEYEVVCADKAYKARQVIRLQLFLINVGG